MDDGRGLAQPTDGTLLQAKLRPRVSASPAMLRAGVLRTIAAEPLPPLTLLNAPAGYGKSTTLRQWWLALRDAGATAGWLTLDRHDDDPAGFVSYLIAALADAGVDVGDLLTAARARLVDTPLATIVPLVIHRVRAHPRPVHLFLDDYHLAASPAIDALVADLLAYAGDAVRLVIATRRRPGISVADLRAKHGVREFDATDLRFDPQECVAYFGYRDDVIDSLVESSEGWPAAIHLARLWLERRALAPAPGQPPSFTGRSAALASYLAEQVFADLPVALRERLLRVSILERFNGDLVDAVCDGADGWAFVEDIEARGLFVSALDDEHQWFALHPLFREFLHERLRRDHGRELPALHRRAVAAFHAGGADLDAVQQAHRSGDAALLAGALTRAGGWCLALRAGAQVLRPLMTIPCDTAIAHPAIGQAQVYVLLQSGDIGEARRRYDDLCRAHAGEDAGSDAVAVSIRFMQNLLSLYEDRPLVEADIERLQRELESPGLRALPEADLVPTFRSYACYERGDYEGCIARGGAALARLVAQGADYGAFFLRCYIGLAHCALGRLDAAALCFEQARRTAVARYSVHSNQVAMAGVLLARIAFERGELEAARGLLPASFDEVRANSGWYDVVVAELTVKSSLLAADGDLAAALALLERGLDYAARRHWPRLAAALVTHRDALRAPVGDRPEPSGRGLSAREEAVLRLLADGFSTKEMARALALSEGTVKVHRKRLYRKLQVHSRSAALAMARSHALLG